MPMTAHVLTNSWRSQDKMATGFGDEFYVPSLTSCIAAFFLILWIVLFILQLISIVGGKLALYTYSPSSNESDLPGVSIIKPLAGEDSHLIKNLQTFFELKYPKFEILFCVQDKRDTTVPVVRQLMQSYPLVNARVFTESRTVGVNPKINNMNQGYVAAKYDLLWICDSAIRVHPNTLSEMVSHMGPKVGLVHQTPYITCTSQSFAQCVDQVYFGTQHAFAYLFSHTCGILCASGMSSLYNKTVLDELGGLQAFSCYIAEDYFMSKAIQAKGYKVALSSEPAMQNPRVQSLEQFQKRMLRWTRLRLAMEPFPSYLEPLTESSIIGVLGALGAWHLWGINLVLFYIIHLGVSFVLDYILLTIVQGPHRNGPLPPIWKVFLAWLFRELFFIVFFLQAAFGRQIEWRTATFRLLHGGKAELLNKCKDANSHCC